VNVGLRFRGWIVDQQSEYNVNAQPPIHPSRQSIRSRENQPIKVHGPQTPLQGVRWRPY
jgi:hypothetical protein